MVRINVPLCRRPAANDLPTLPLMRGAEGRAANHPPRSDRHSATATPAIAAHLNNIARRLMALGTSRGRGKFPISAHATHHAAARCRPLPPAAAAAAARRMSMAGWGAV